MTGPNQTTPGGGAIQRKRPNHWFVAAWPGMGNVAMLAAGYLVQKLGLKQIGEVKSPGRFDVGAVEVRGGLVGKPRMPRNVLYQSPEGGEGPKLTVFMGEAQPQSGSLMFAQELVGTARSLGADRIVTFASMAAQLEPATTPRVMAAVTSPDLLDELARLEVPGLAEGQIGGLNGVMLGAAAEQQIPAMGLMSEIPFYAAGVVNPRAARAVLDSFSLMSGIDLNLSDLDPHIEAIDEVLAKMLHQLLERQGSSDDHDDDDESEIDAPDQDDAAPAAGSKMPQLDEVERQRIEAMFETAQHDRAAAATLKRELDRLGVFTLYEDRFLDLFKRAD